ncbi:MAG: septation protein A [Myxococcota bacterium]|jgi:intracellular septation protein
MKFFIDLFPIVIFFFVYQQSDLYDATLAVMIACALQTFGYRLFAKEFDRNHILALVLVVPFGALTLIFRDPTFIKWNGTVELWLLAIGLIGSQYIGDQPLIQRMLGGGLELPEPIWRKLNFIWAAFFVASGAANLYVAYNYEEETWVNFRMFGMTGLSVVFVAANLVWIMRVAPPPDDGLDDNQGHGDDEHAATRDE